MTASTDLTPLPFELLQTNMRLELEVEPKAAVATLEENGHPHSQLSDDPAALLKKGIAAAQKGDREQARAQLTRAAEIDPHSEDAWMWLASISDYPEELLAFLNKVLGINPGNQRAVEWHAATRSLLAKTFVQRGIAAREHGSADLAVSCFDQAIGHDEDCALAWFWKASVSTSDDQKINCLERALQLDPANEDAQKALASLKTPEATLEEAKSAAVAGKRRKAMTVLDEVLQNSPDNAEAWILRSHLSLGLKDKLESLEKALQIEPDNQSARAGYDFLAATVRDAHSADHAAAAHDTPAKPVEEAAPEAVVEIPSETHNIQDLAVSPVEEVDSDILTIDTFVPVIEATVDTVPANEEPASVELNVAVVDDPSPDEVAFEDAPAPAPDIVAAAAHFPEQPVGVLCPFCDSSVEAQAFECSNCHAMLTLSDIESLLANSLADRDAIEQAVTRMEAEWNFREFNAHELAALGIGHFNLRNFESGSKYLEEASRLDPNNVILAGQVNALAIRIEEMRRQDEAHEAMPKGKLILVVDDSPTVRKLISAKLEKCGHNVSCAADGVEGLEKMEGELPDLVLLDIAMPRMDGYEVCKQIRSNPAAADIPVLMISGKDGFFDKVRGKMAGATGYITKPFGPETLMKALDTYLLPENGLDE